MSTSAGTNHTERDGRDGSGCSEIVRLSSAKKFPRRNAMPPKTFGMVVADFPKVSTNS